MGRLESRGKEVPFDLGSQWDEVFGDDALLSDSFDGFGADVAEDVGAGDVRELDVFHHHTDAKGFGRHDA